MTALHGLNGLDLLALLIGAGAILFLWLEGRPRRD